MATVNKTLLSKLFYSEKALIILNLYSHRKLIKKILSV